MVRYDVYSKGSCARRLVLGASAERVDTLTGGAHPHEEIKTGLSRIAVT